MKRFEALDALRGVAAILVVIYHYTVRYFELYPQTYNFSNFMEFGKLGVNMFFIISGYVIFMTLLKIEKPIDFLVTRFIRLYPIFWVAVIFTFAIVYSFNLENREVSISDMLINLTMIPALFKTPYVDGVYWTLLYELKFYLLIFLVYISGLIKKIEYLAIFPIIIIISSFIFNIEHTLFYKILNFFLILDYLPYFISGIMLYKIHEKNYNILTICVLVTTILINLYNIKYDFLWFILLTYLIFILISLNKINWISNKFLVYLGSISYSLYLIHQNLGYIVLNYCNKIDLESYLSLFIAIMLSIFISSVITYIIEKPIINYLKNKYKKEKENIVYCLNNSKICKFLVVHKND